MAESDETQAVLARKKWLGLIEEYVYTSGERSTMGKHGKERRTQRCSWRAASIGISTRAGGRTTAPRRESARVGAVAGIGRGENSLGTRNGAQVLAQCGRRKVRRQRAGAWAKSGKK